MKFWVGFILCVTSAAAGNFGTVGLVLLLAVIAAGTS